MASASLHSGGFLPVATASLRPEAGLNCDLYLQRPGARFAELYRGSSYPLEPADIDGLRTSGVDHLYIRLEAADSYREYLCKHVLHDPSVPPTQRLSALQEVTRVAFQ